MDGRRTPIRNPWGEHLVINTVTFGAYIWTRYSIDHIVRSACRIVSLTLDDNFVCLPSLGRTRHTRVRMDAIYRVRLG